MSITVEEFEAARPHLLSVAHRMLGSIHDAQDAVQTTWLRVAAARDAQPIDSPAAWLTTVTARVCLDELRARRRRNETPLLADAIPAEQLAADEAVLRTENVSRALMVLLNRLTPPQRVAYVLHDLFAVPFDQIARVLDATVPSAKKHASRARQRLDPPLAVPEGSGDADQEIVEAFLAAARSGDIHAMVRLLAPDSVREADAALLPPGAPTVVTGASAIANETVHFVDRIRTVCRLTVSGAPVYLIAPGGHPLASLRVSTAGGQVTRITVRSVRTEGDFAPSR